MTASAFSEILVEHGFLPYSYDFAATALGFQHEIFNVLIHDDPVFTTDSSIHEQLCTPDAMLRCELVTRPGDLTAGIAYFYQQWFRELRYSAPVLQIINLNQNADTATFEILTMSQHNAMTFLFTIK